MSGKRLAEARKNAGISQAELADALGGHVQSMVSHIEAGRRHLRYDAFVIAARELGVSLDYLAGLTDDPTPAARRNGAGHNDAPATAESRAAYATGSNGHDADMVPIGRIETLDEVAPAAGSGAAVYNERVTGWVPFRFDWLRAHSIDPEHSNIVPVSGDSMYPTLPDGCSILVDRKRREPHEGRIYVMRTEDGLVVKRLGRDAEGCWQVKSDNPDWKPKLLAYGSEIVGEVRWIGVTL